MKSLTRIALVAATALFTLAGDLAAQADDYRKINIPPLRQVNIPQPKRIQLANGMVIFLQEDRELPIIRGGATIRGGERDVPAAKAGMIGILAGSWRTGGTPTRTGDQLDELLEARAAILETGADEDSMNVSINVLKQDFDTVFPLFVDLLRNPAFRQEKIDLAKTQTNTVISRRNDDPSAILARESAKLGYGKDSPLARHAEYATIAAITRDDLLAFHKQFVHPNNVILSFVGDFDSARLERTLRQTFESWRRGPQAAKYQFTSSPARPGIYFVQKEDVTQANIAMLHPGTTRDNPDFYALTVMNEVFGGGFSGRLMQRLRSQRGLTYGVGGGVGANWDHPGLFRVQMATKSGTTIESVEALRSEVASLVNSPVTAEELSLAKESILNAHVFQTDTRAKALNQAVLLEFYGYPADWYQRYPQQIERVTAEDVTRVAKKYVQPNQLAVLVVGRQSDFERPLSSLGGEVHTIDVTIPEPGARPASQSGSPQGGTGGATAAPAATVSTPQAMALARKVADFMGGKARFDALQAIRITGTRTLQTPQGAMNANEVTTLRFPDQLRQEMVLPMGTITTVITPQGGFALTPMGTQDLPSSQREMISGQLRSDTIAVIRNLDNPRYIFTLGGTEKIGTVDAQILEVNADGSHVRWYVEPATGRLIRRVTSGGPTGETAVDYTDWKKFGDLNLAASSTLTRNGEKAGEQTITNVEANPAIEASAFTKPAS